MSTGECSEKKKNSGDSSCANSINNSISGRSTVVISIIVLNGKISSWKKSSDSGDRNNGKSSNNSSTSSRSGSSSNGDSCRSITGNISSSTNFDSSI